MGSASDITRFGEFELDRGNRRLRCAGKTVELGSRYFDALALLVSRSGELVTKDEFMTAVWQGIPVTDEALTQCVRTLRRALGDDASAPRFIATVPKHGYRFLAQPVAASRALGLDLSQLAGAATLGGLGAGLLAGAVYGLIAGTGGGSGVMILAAMIGALGLLAGAGVGTGMAAAIALRRRPDASVIAGAGVGGLAVGALGNLLGREAVGLLTGVPIGEATGPFEGVLIGLAVGVAIWLALTGRSRRVVIGAAAVAGAAAGALIHLAGGTLLAGSLVSLQSELPATRLAMERVSTAPLATSVIEAIVFVLALVVAYLLARRTA